MYLDEDKCKYMYLKKSSAWKHYQALQALSMKWLIVSTFQSSVHFPK